MTLHRSAAREGTGELLTKISITKTWQAKMESLFRRKMRSVKMEEADNTNVMTSPEPLKKVRAFSQVSKTVSIKVSQ